MDSGPEQHQQQIAELLQLMRELRLLVARQNDLLEVILEEQRATKQEIIRGLI